MIHNYCYYIISVFIKVLKVKLNNREITKTAVKANRVDNDIEFPSFTCVRYPTVLLELSNGISLEFLVTLI